MFAFGGYLIYLGADRLMRGKITWHVADLFERSLGTFLLYLRRLNGACVRVCQDEEQEQHMRRMSRASSVGRS